jgi:hypothetical protein
LSKSCQNSCQKVVKKCKNVVKVVKKFDANFVPLNPACQGQIWQNRLKSSFLQQCAKNRQMLLFVTTMRKKSHPNAEKRDFQLKTYLFVLEKSTGEFSAFLDQMRQSRIW